MSWNVTPLDDHTRLPRVHDDARGCLPPIGVERGKPNGAFRFICLAKIANFNALRRRLGCERANRLILEVLVTINRALPDAKVAIVGRSVVEIAFMGGERAALDRAIHRLRTTFDNMHTGNADCVVMAFAGAVGVPGDEEAVLHEAAEAELEQSLAISGSPDQHRLGVAMHAPTANDLPAAIAAGEMVLHYQPKVHLRQSEVASAEALVRWNHPRLGLIPPGQFIPAAEDTRHICPLTLWTLRQVIADQRRLATKGRDIPLFLNISGVLLGDQPFVAEACDLVRAGGAKIGFEITETSVIRDPDTAIANLNTFAGIGIRIAIDDYGAGLSSLAYLKRLPARELKIDKLFVTQLTSSNRDPLIVRSTIDLAHALDMEVTAEGVESPAALALLSVMGCDLAQGYLLGYPVPLDEFETYLANDHHLRATTASPLSDLATSWKRA